MSTTANWSYSNVATIYPLLDYDNVGSQYRYEDPYLISCTWSEKNEVAVDNTGKEFIARRTVYTERKYDGSFVRKPERDDYISLGDTTAQADPMQAGADRVIAVNGDDMSFFDEDPDYAILT